jgi:hypothetical protein
MKKFRNFPVRPDLLVPLVDWREFVIHPKVNQSLPLLIRERLDQLLAVGGVLACEYDTNTLMGSRDTKFEAV